VTVTLSQTGSVGPRLTLHLLPQDFTILRLPTGAPPPDWAFRSRVWALSQIPQEVTLVVETAVIPADCLAERTNGWRGLLIDEAFDFAVPGILASVLSPLAKAGIGIFASSTYSTDCVWVAARDLAEALSALTKAGHTLHEEP
jgi:hypothetical protein